MLEQMPLDMGPGDVEAARAYEERRRRLAEFNNRVALRLHLAPGPENEYCRTCDRLVRKTWQRSYWKCAFLDTNGEGSDVRLYWQACERWTPTTMSIPARREAEFA